MTAFDPHEPPRSRGRFSLATVAAIALALLVGGILQEIRWRGGFAGITPSPIESGAEQLKLARLAFKNGDDAVALHLFELLADQNNATAQYWLAHMTELGLGVPKDIPKAISLYEKAAAQNSVPAQARLGEIYLNGDLVSPDYAKAFDLLGKAARQGDPRAAMLLGQMFRFGLGTVADPIESYAWSEVAVIEGLGFAKIEREAAFASMSPSDREKGAARAAVLLSEIRKKPAPAKKP
ncbi:MAG: tetratricopeptide repeat protein [Roseiarcus sp.]|jgi:TPR repeat protein